MLDFSTALTYIKGVGPGRAAMFEAKGLRTVEDLLSYFPFRYEDRSNMKPIAQLAPGEMATVIAEVRSAKLAERTSAITVAISPGANCAIGFMLLRSS